MVTLRLGPRRLFPCCARVGGAFFALRALRREEGALRRCSARGKEEREKRCTWKEGQELLRERTWIIGKKAGAAGVACERRKTEPPAHHQIRPLPHPSKVPAAGVLFPSCPGPPVSSSPSGQVIHNARVSALRWCYCFLVKGRRQEARNVQHGCKNMSTSVMYGNTYTRRHRARDVQRAVERAGRLIQQAARPSG
jgi:hypothetical protein